MRTNLHYHFFLILEMCVCIRIPSIASQTPHQWKGLRNDILNEYTAQHSHNVDWSRSLASSSGLQKSPVKDMVHAPIPPRYLLPLKGWQLHHSKSEIWSHTWQPSAVFSLSLSLFSLSDGTRGSYRHHRIRFISLAASAPSVVILWRLSMTPPPTPPDTLLLFSI